MICTFSMQADIYVGPLQTVQLTGMKYYHAPSVPADIFSPDPNGAADRYEILPRFWHASQHILFPAPSVAADSHEILLCPEHASRHIFSPTLNGAANSHEILPCSERTSRH